MSEATTLRRRHDALKNTLDQERPAPSRGNESWLLKTVTVAAYPTSAIAAYGVQKVTLLGAETEGATPSFSAIAASFYAINTGIGVPAVGTYVIGDLISGRWVFHYDG